MNNDIYNVIAGSVLRDIQNAEDLIDPRNGSSDPEGDRIRLAILELEKAASYLGEPRKTFVRTARVILSSIVPDEEI